MAIGAGGGATSMGSLAPTGSLPEGAHEGLSKKNFRTYSKLFRDPAAWEVVEDEVLWELGKAALRRPAAQSGGAAGRRTIEAWSVGSSAGEEVFSLLLSWEQALSAHLPGVDLRVEGTDCSAKAVEAARCAEYGVHATQDVPLAWLERCFDARELEGQTQYALHDRLKQRASFAQQDVREALPEKKFDLVTCRYSVFLYCDKQECTAFLRDLTARCLKPGGFLMIGQPDELPREWPTLGLEEWRGHVGLYRFAEPTPEAAPASDLRAPHGSLSAFLGGVQRPAEERIGRPAPEPEAVRLTADDVAENLERFDRWHEEKEEKRQALKAEEEAKEEALAPETVFISSEKADAFVQRMQHAAEQADRRRREMLAQVERSSTKARKKRVVSRSRRRSGASLSKDDEVAVQRRAEAASALWIARSRAAKRKAEKGKGGVRRPSTTVPTGAQEKLVRPQMARRGSSPDVQLGQRKRLMTEVEQQREVRVAQRRPSSAVSTVRRPQLACPCATTSAPVDTAPGPAPAP
ncbi:MAG: CheR family methyltransferase, partial [Actinomycetota bacterium]|nr:CheR family methyltransferase [Actinomycetota bacterium]